MNLPAREQVEKSHPTRTTKNTLGNGHNIISSSSQQNQTDDECGSYKVHCRIDHIKCIIDSCFRSASKYQIKFLRFDWLLGGEMSKAIGFVCLGKKLLQVPNFEKSCQFENRFL